MKYQVNVVWYGDVEQSKFRGSWDMGILDDLTAGPKYKHYEGIDALPKDSGAVVVVPSRLWLGKEEAINKAIQSLTYVVLILCGNEEADFDLSKIKHPMLRVWVQLPRMNLHNDVSYKLVNGYRPNTPQVLKEIGRQERIYDYSFAGQINHERRQQCIDVLRQFEPLYNCRLAETDSFAKEALNQREYLTMLAQTKIAPCPSGVESPDSFRLYEALEAGCLPVVDAFSTQFKTAGFWQYLFNETPPFPIIDYWDKFPILLPQLLKEYPANVNRVSAWWQLKKREIGNKLIDDIRILHG